MCVGCPWNSGVGDPWYYPKGPAWVLKTRGTIRKGLYGCERPAVLSKKLCGGVRDPRCKQKSSVAQKKTHDHVYHLDLELSDRSRD